ncbi:MAG: pyruvate kinase alpha/beta domain-containing protein [Caldilineaceae bacterium]
MQTAGEVGAKVIVAPTVSGATAKPSSHRPRSASAGDRGHAQPHGPASVVLYWGTYPLLTRRLSNTDEVVSDAIDVARRNHFVNEGDTVVLTAGVVGSVRSATNLLMIRKIERVLARGIGLGQREVAGTLLRIHPPISDGNIRRSPGHPLLRNHRSQLHQVAQQAAGIVTREGDLDSPAAVAAVDLGLPAVIGVGEDFSNLSEGAKVIMDATTGAVTGVAEVAASTARPRVHVTKTGRFAGNLGPLFLWRVLRSDALGLEVARFGDGTAHVDAEEQDQPGREEDGHRQQRQPVVARKLERKAEDQRPSQLVPRSLTS